MYRATESMQPLLHASHYTTLAAHQHDVMQLRNRSWQLVASSCQLRNPGDYVSVERLGVPLLVRNFDGELTAVQNVCAHRQCRLVDQAHGRSEELKCPYHGWRYGSDGRTRKIPGASNFPHFERENYRLPVYEVQQVGQLIFVRFSAGRETAPSDLAGPCEAPEDGRQLSDRPLDDWDIWSPLFSRLTDSARWRLVYEDEMQYECDWKIPIEGALESYHLDEIHGETLGADPGESQTEHDFDESGTSFKTSVRERSFLAQAEEGVVRAISGSFDPTYRHVHVFPNVMASFTSTLSLVYQIYPVGPQRAGMKVFGYTRRSERWGAIGNGLSLGLGRAARGFAKKVFREDARIFPEVQLGMMSSDRQRIFGRCEERLHAFHQHWAATYNQNHQ